MRKLLTLAIPLLLGVGILTAFLYTPAEEKKSSPRRQAGVAVERALPAVIEESPTTTATGEPTTSTTAASAPAPAPVPAPPSTTTSTAAKPMTTVTTQPPVAPKPKPAATTTTLAPAPEPEPTESAAPSTIDCGTGTASARAIYGSTTETTSLYAEVVNESNREIELDRLAVNASYPNGATKTYTLDVAGKRLQPGEKAVFSIPDSAPQGAPKEFTIGEFGFHTAGLPECASH